MRKVFFALLSFFLLYSSFANNITLSNASFNGQNTTSQYSLVNFDVFCKNSWRTITNESNYKGTWIFVKFRKKLSNTWQHATLSSMDATAPASSVPQTLADGKGFWLYHSLPGADFTGNVAYTGAKIQWLAAGVYTLQLSPACFNGAQTIGKRKIVLPPGL